MGAYALVELGDSEAIDVFVRKEDALQALEDAVMDEPGVERKAVRLADRA
jgi:hypothetical protein